MQDRPDAPELAQAIREFLETEVLPRIDDPRLRFRALVAANGLGILERELELGPALLRREVEALARFLGAHEAVPEAVAALQARGRELNRELARRVRAGDPPEGTLAHLKTTVADKLRVASPRYLDRYR